MAQIILCVLIATGGSFQRSATPDDATDLVAATVHPVLRRVLGGAHPHAHLAIPHRAYRRRTQAEPTLDVLQ